MNGWSVQQINSSCPLKCVSMDNFSIANDHFRKKSAFRPMDARTDPKVVLILVKAQVMAGWIFSMNSFIYLQIYEGTPCGSQYLEIRDNL